MKRLVAVFALTLSGFSAFSDEPDLVGGARRAAAYWNSRYGRCSGNAAQGGAWYGVVADEPGCTNCAKPGSIQMVPELKIRFRTEELTQEERLNGFEFKATTSLEPGAFRWWSAENRAWGDWQVGEIAAGEVFIRKRGVWSNVVVSGMAEQNLKALTTCSQIPPMNDEKR